MVRIKPSPAREYRRSVDLLDSYQSCAYEVVKLDGLYHVTMDETGNSMETYDTVVPALRHATQLNRDLLARIGQRAG